jgi:beta-phosphoglucomutase-like phosphatase (HAD superfamily)
MTEAVLCELEGVLVDTSVARLRALRESFAEERITLPDAVYAEHCAGRPTEDAIRSALDAMSTPLDDVAITLVALRAERRFAELAGHGVLLAPGAMEFMERSQGLARLALVTHLSRREAEIMLAPTGLDAAFECIVCAEDAPVQKPLPAPYQHALQRLERRRPLRRGHTVALEAGLDGIRAARAAGVRCIAVGELPEAVRAEADAAIPSLIGQSPGSLGALIARPEEVVG